MFGSDPLATSPYTPFLARLTAVASGSGGQANWHLYSWKEQGWDSNGFPVDLNPGRTGSPSSGYAFEVNNTLLTVPGTTPTGFTNPGPYVWMKLKGVVGGIAVYEFDAGSATGTATIQWVKVTSATGSTITIGSGTVTAYPAVLTTWNTATATWSDSTTVWFFSANGEIPIVSNRYECVSFGTASDAKAVWGRDGYTATNFSGAKYIRGGAISCPTALTDLNLSGAGSTYDTDNYTPALVAPVTGYYRGFFQAEFGTTTSGTYTAGLRAVTSNADPTQISGEVKIQASGSQDLFLQVVFEGHMAQGDTITCRVFQNTGGAINVINVVACIQLMLIPGVLLNTGGGSITGEI